MECCVVREKREKTQTRSTDFTVVRKIGLYHPCHLLSVCFVLFCFIALPRMRAHDNVRFFLEEICIVLNEIAPVIVRLLLWFGGVSTLSHFEFLTLSPQAHLSPHAVHIA